MLIFLGDAFVCLIWGLHLHHGMPTLVSVSISVPSSQGVSHPLGFPPVVITECKRTAHLGLMTSDSQTDGEAEERLITCLMRNI